MLAPGAGRDSGTIAFWACAAVAMPTQAISATAAVFADMSACPFRAHDHEQRAREDPEVEPQRPVRDVRQVELHPSIEARDVVSSADLPETGDPRDHGQSLRLPSRVCSDFARRRRPGTDEAHVTHQDVPQLRELVEAVLAQEATERRRPRIARDLECRALYLVEVDQLAFP